MPGRPFSISPRHLQGRSCQPTTQPLLRKPWPDSRASPSSHLPAPLPCTAPSGQARGHPESSHAFLPPHICPSHSLCLGHPFLLTCKTKLSVTSSGKSFSLPEVSPYPSLISSPQFFPHYNIYYSQFAHLLPHQPMSSLRAESLTQSATLAPDPGTRSGSW